MKYIFLVFILISQLFGSVVKSPLVSVNEDESQATIKIKKIDVGMSGFIVHKLADNHSSILKNAVVKSYDENTQLAILELSEYNALRNNALPSGKWKVKAGDMAVLAFGYTRGLLIAPNEKIYYRITKSIRHLQWIHPDLFATILSFNGHPTPLQEDFSKLSIATSTGLLFFYLNERVFTVDAKSFKVLNISDAPLVQESTNLPFYTRVEEIDAAWWGEGSNELEDYESHYYTLLVTNNKKSQKLYDIVKNGDEKIKYLLEKFEIGDK